MIPVFPFSLSAVTPPSLPPFAPFAMSKRGADRQITKDDQGSDNEGEQMEEQVSGADSNCAHDSTMPTDWL